MRISKLACFAPPPFAPDEVEPGVFILRQVFDREQILWRVAKTMLVFMIVITVLAWLSQILGLVWPNASTLVLMRMLLLMPYPLLVVGWLLWTLMSFVRYFTERSRTREVRIELRTGDTQSITVNDRRFEGPLIASEIRIRHGRGHLVGAERFLAIYIDTDHHVQLVVCTKNAAELERWQERLEINGLPNGTALPVRGVL